MNLDKFYSLRTSFTVIAITGRVGSGCSQIADKLAKEDFNQNLNSLIIKNSLNPENIKSNICTNYLSHPKNWTAFKKILYKDILLFHVLFYAAQKSESILDTIEKIIEIICQNDPELNPEILGNRFTNKDDKLILFEKLKGLLLASDMWYLKIKEFKKEDLNSCLSNKKNYRKLYEYYFNEHEELSLKFYEILNNHNFIKRTRFIHDIANNLRNFGSVVTNYSAVKGKEYSYNHIYTVAETINRVIKCWRYVKKGKTKTRIVIDSLKNSREAMYFKEKFAAFYMIATNKSEEERIEYLKSKLISKKVLDSTIQDIYNLDESEYKGEEVNNGEFASPDIINCIQISDYHIFFSNKQYGSLEPITDGLFKNNNYQFISLDRQLVKLVSLVQQPGLITPSAIERSMQIAFNAKLSSGCISRQVGALVTDQNFSIKAIGWNDVPQNQLPCNLRNAQDLINKNNTNQFSDFELGQDNSNTYSDDQTFHDKFKSEVNEKHLSLDLEGRNCSFCFKSFHNAFEGEKNQVHTRSLHAEENAMLQISKSGGQGIKGGKLFTTASPCELCAKKAFQLGIMDIYFIDPYPGISKRHVLKGGVNINPSLMMFQGAVGRAYHKLYEPFMAYKDELAILTDIRPKAKPEKLLSKLTNDKTLQKKLLDTIINHKEY
ncbi:hypothetical protein [Ulvibacter litoralis]|uniref:Deoxycytidylate deaminase n=1 Tax=Ulvibacter litoralis TaxID=227084 RepID=A0A1G7CAT6_9FLAO|nr:hypothetical protein [Ulvibacter litoralis]GHC48042.1 deoxycytidylate deaminase [Ulvibacter litoralis]SDE36333.1 Deoxycytidylate deaminase [Ulvibacter litoralis]